MLPITENIAKRQVTLPLYPSMKTDDVNYVIDNIDRFMKDQKD